ncbi:methyl-accepting chemotaxis protein [Ectothiorhodospira mobilis]|uniref:methyl-accepting chemotaxis protein n=1 Tax=Ectothiorhodospira mobilis TaxID=195064 RepID=UPI001EE89B73|nr:methyl-accepting chemotaxis protein [Ectothiorhodospira mobilis]MCG5535859.1 methyl-accepting chemotaxis protein [Ectothiorhodospira mobilis]
MLQRLRIGQRLILGVALTLVVMLAVLLPLVVGQLNGIIREAEERELRALHDEIVGRIDAEAKVGAAVSGALAQLDSITRRFAQRDREALRQLLMPMHDYLREEYAVRQFQFHTAPATSFLRLHRPGKFGDDLSGFRHTVVEVNRTGRPVRGLESGVAGLGIRGVVPVRHAGEPVGSLELGMSFGEPFFQRIRDEWSGAGMHIALHTLRDGRLEPFASTWRSADLMPEGTLRGALDTGEAFATARLGGDPVAVYAAPVQDYSGEPVGVLAVSLDRSYYVQAAAMARNTVLGVGLLALLAGLVTAWFMGRTITRPMRRAVEAMRDIAEGEGDLTRRLETGGRDEIAEVAAAFNRFAERVQETVRQVGGSTEHLAAASEQMTTVTTRTNEGMQRQRTEIEQVVTAMNEMTSTVQDVARNAEYAAEAAREADGSAGEGSWVVKESMQSIRQLAEDVNRAAESINRLGKDSEGIGAVLDVIRGIAEQTNLLALNAAIEAARAGEAGRGFAVVADEVRTLASRTQDSTQEIQGMIEQLQQAARESVQVMEQGRNRASGTVEQAGSAEQALSRITDAVSRISDMNAQIASAAEEQSTVADEINRNLVHINDISEETAEGAKQTAGSGEELTRLTRDLQGLVGRFRY